MIYLFDQGVLSVAGMLVLTSCLWLLSVAHSAALGAYDTQAGPVDVPAI